MSCVTTAFQDDRERKHLFLASSGQECDQWVSAIRNASYEQLKATLIMLRNKIKRLTDMVRLNSDALEGTYDFKLKLDISQK